MVTPSAINTDQGPINGAAISPNKSIDVKKAALSHNDGEQSKSSHASFALGILLPIIVVASLVMWVFYAYRNPHTKSGQLLIQVRFISYLLKCIFVRKLLFSITSLDYVFRIINI